MKNPGPGQHAGKSRGPGRPPLPKGTAKGGVFTLRMTASERAEIDAAAARESKKVTTWAHDLLIDWARARNAAAEK